MTDDNLHITAALSNILMWLWCPCWCQCVVTQPESWCSCWCVNVSQHSSPSLGVLVGVSVL